VEVGLVGITTFGGDLGCAEARGPMVCGVFEADQPGRALGREADLGAESGPLGAPLGRRIDGGGADERPGPTATVVEGVRTVRRRNNGD
jgi:hypothetical protein